MVEHDGVERFSDMSFISYAQNFEDVMLWRALKHIKNGFYIDVGAAGPDQHSVTKCFYSMGWRGINIEPNPEFNQLLKKQRQKDINLRLAVGDRNASMMMKFIPDTGVLTAIESIATTCRASEWTFKEDEIELTTLATVCKQYLERGQSIHFLKVDVEGGEEAALLGNDWTLFRPWIVVVASILPLTQTESHESWEPVLLNADYSFAYADGLNRFYVAQEHSELLQAFRFPPNVFDDFILSSQLELQEAEHWYRQELAAIHASRSWRVTAPFRRMANHARIVRESLRERLISPKPHSRAYVKLVRWRDRMRSRFAYVGAFLGAGPKLSNVDLSHLTPSAKQIYADLSLAVQSKKRRSR